MSIWYYRFDAVSDRETVVAAILCNRPATRTGRENTGGVRKALSEIGWLKGLPCGVTRIMVFTDTGFRDLVSRRAARLGIEGIRMIVCHLPPELAEELKQVLDVASREQRAAE